MGKTQFDRMKKKSYFINTSRGALVDEKALFQALQTGKLRAAALDVFEQEPATMENPLFSLNNLICTPHTAGETQEAYRTISLANAHAIIDVFHGKKPKNCLTNSSFEHELSSEALPCAALRTARWNKIGKALDNRIVRAQTPRPPPPG